MELIAGVIERTQFAFVGRFSVEIVVGVHDFGHDGAEDCLEIVDIFGC